MPYVDELLKLAPLVRAHAEPFAATVKDCYWINTPNGDLGLEYCYDCGSKMIENLRSEDVDNAQDYILDGGWCISHDHTVACNECGVRLNGSLTDYGASEELTHYVCEGIHSFSPEIAYDISELIDHYDWQNENSDMKEANDCIILAKAFLAGVGHERFTGENHG